MLKKIYYWLHKITSRPEERGEYSAGYWQDCIRKSALRLCRGFTGRLLEIGCGEGLFLIQLAGQNQNLEIYGIDNNQARLDEANRKVQERNVYNIRLLLQEAQSLSFENEYFDAVVCVNVLFNLASFDTVRQVLLQMKRVCKRSGRVIIEFRNSRNLLLLFKYRLARYYDRTVKALPLRCYSQREIVSLLGEAGFSVTRTISIGLPFLSYFAPIIIIEAQRK